MFLQLTLREQLHQGHVLLEDLELFYILQNLHLDFIEKGNTTNLSLLKGKQDMLHLCFGQKQLLLPQYLLLLKTGCIRLNTLQRHVHMCTSALGTAGYHCKSNEEKWTFCTPH